jgi:3-hydroxyacyl-CoA dehydrogenase/enoyl-CoA hydratase/3-hydroxybutyryl-CoA epimerase
MAFFQTQNLWVNQLADGVAALVLDVPGHKVNVLTPQVFADLEQALDRVSAETGFQVLVLRSGKERSFCAGADLHVFAGKTPAECQAFSERGQQLFDKLAGLRLVSVAVIAGACLGGGLELALACDYRLVVDKPETRLGLPEIELGLIPGWGGTQRLPRTVGLERALQIILGGRRLTAAEAVRWGLADAICKNEDDPLKLLAEPVKRPRTRLPLTTWRQRLLESTGLGRALIYRGTRRLLQRRLPDDMPAPREALDAVRIGTKDGVAAGLACEREAVGRLVTTSACRNLVHVFLAREQARKSLQQPETARPLRRVGVMGAGTMGAGIAQLAVLHGCEVVVREANETALGFAMLRLMGLLRDAVTRGRLAANNLTAKLAAIHGTTAWKGFDNLDLVIEAIPEDLAQKQALFRQAEDNTAQDTLFASNTSSLTIHDLQEQLQRPERLAGLHFFNPVHAMPLVEVVRGPRTNPQHVAMLARWAASLGKTPIVVKDSPGFVVNRVLMPYLNEAVRLVSEGLKVERIDQAMRRFGMPMGPLELLDQVGLDVAAHIGTAVGPAFGERLKLQPGFGLMAENGWLGRKTGTGFYRYRGKRKRVNHLAVNLLMQTSEAAGATAIEAASVSDQEASIRERLVGLMVSEARRCLQEGLAENADAIDLAMVLGAGWAPHRGGPLRYAAVPG